MKAAPAILSVFLFLICTFECAATPTVSIIHNFATQPLGAGIDNVVAEPDGTLYGTTWYGGTTGAGVIYSVSPASQYSVIHSFGTSEGGSPNGLTKGPDGRYYGTTFSGGANGNGTVFVIGVDGTFSVLHDFNGDDGDDPIGLLANGPGGLYGVTGFGGTHNYGTIFKIATDGTFTKLHDFTSGVDGNTPLAGMTLGIDGAFYGTTQGEDIIGGADNFGSVFRMTPDGTLTTIYNFTGVSDGSAPTAGLVQTADGTLYGTTSTGGSNGQGTIFKITTDGTFSPLYQVSSVDGLVQASSLTLANDGNLYGTLFSFSFSSDEAIFQLTPAGQVTVEHIFSFPDGSQPLRGLTKAPNGTLYGGASSGGSTGAGTLFSFKTDGTFALVETPPSSDEFEPLCGLTLAGDGTLYGTTFDSGGVVFKIATDGSYSVVHSFDSDLYNEPSSAVSIGTDGTLYGTTTEGGSGNGSLFAISPTGDFATLLTMANSFGRVDSSGGPSPAPAGDIFVPTAGTPSINSAIYRVTPLGDATLVHVFDGTYGWTVDGPIILGPDGNYYGVTSGGGNAGNSSHGLQPGDGTIFRISPDGTFTSLYLFSGPDGLAPRGPLTVGIDGALYGVTSQGGVNDLGSIYRLTTDGTFTSLHSFDASEGQTPNGGMVERSDGTFYGTTFFGGANDLGTIFSFIPGGSVSTVYSFGDQNIGDPNGGLVQTSDGTIYGTASGYTFGGVFAVKFPAPTPTLASVTVAPKALSGNQTGVVTLTLNGPAPAGGTVVSLVSNNRTAAKVSPTSVTVPAGSTTATSTVKAYAVSTNTLVTLTAKAGVSHTCHLTVLAPNVQKVQVLPTKVVGGAGIQTGTVTLTGPAASNMTVSISTDNADTIIPSYVIVNAGKTTATFQVKTKHVTAVETSTITTKFGATSTSCLITIKPN